MKSLSAFLVSLALVPIVCCAPPAQEEAATDQASTAEADIEAVREVVSQVDATLTAGDLDGWMALWDDYGVELPPLQPVLVGKEAIRERDGEFLANNTTQIRSTVEDVQFAGDWAYVRDSYTESWTPKEGGDTTSVVGKSVYVLRRQTDGSWKIYSLIWNMDAAW